MKQNVPVRPSFNQNEVIRIGIINRGEAALRFIRSLKEYRAREQINLQALAFYLDDEEEALFVRSADLALPFSRFTSKTQNGSLYLDKQLILSMLMETNCRLIWPGWGFLSEDADFASLLEEQGIQFIGPAAASMKLLGDKIQAKELAEKTGIPILPWSLGALDNLDHAAQWAEKIGYPVILKAAHGGGGRGIRFVWNKDELEEQYDSVLRETEQITGGKVLFMERLVENPAHLEVQVLADGKGLVHTFGIRDCSVQRKNQKIIEETPPPHVPVSVQKEMQVAAGVLIEAAAYKSAGTVEFLYDRKTRAFYFMEVNTRLQVEHPVTEMVYQIDFIKEQLNVALGKPFSAKKWTPRGSAMEARLNCEDPDRDFIPAPGHISVFVPPSGPGVRVDCGFGRGSIVPSFFDSMLGKIIVCGRDRAECLVRLDRALDELVIRIDGGTTNRAFLKTLLASREIQKGGVTTHFVESFLKTQETSIDRADIALLAGAVYQGEERLKEELIYFKEQLARMGQPRQNRALPSHKINIRYEQRDYHFLVAKVDRFNFHVEVDKQILPLYFKAEENGFRLSFNKQSYNVQMVRRGAGLICEIDGKPFLLELESGGILRSPAPATVLRLYVQPGQQIKPGEPMVALEAMKMEMILDSKCGGIVKEVLIFKGDQVTAGQELIVLETETESREQADSSLNIEFPPSIDCNNNQNLWQINRARLEALFLGYEGLEDYQNVMDGIFLLLKSDAEIQRDFTNLFVKCLSVFLSVETLFSNQRTESAQFSRVVTNREMLLHYFRRDMDESENSPLHFRNLLSSTLQFYYSKKELTRENKHNALFYIYRSHANLAIKESVFKKMILQMNELDIEKVEHKNVSMLLEKLALLSLHSQIRLAGSAIQLRYKLIDRQYLVQGRERDLRTMRIQIQDLAKLSDGPLKQKLPEGAVEDFPENIEELAELCLVSDPAEREVAISVLALAFNRDRNFKEGEVLINEEGSYYSSEESGGNSFLLVVIKQAQPELIVEQILNLSTRLKTSPEIIVINMDENNLQPMAAFVEPFTVISFSWISYALREKNQAFSFHTFICNKQTGLQSDKRKDPLNPLLYREFRLHRFSAFHISIIAHINAIYLYKMTAKDNRADERLVLCFHVTEREPQTDLNGTILRLPQFEFRLIEAANLLRTTMIKLPKAISWNRMVISTNLELPSSPLSIKQYAKHLLFRLQDLGLEKVIIYGRQHYKNKERAVEASFSSITARDFQLHMGSPSTKPLLPMDEYAASLKRAHQLNAFLPEEIVNMIPGETSFREYDISIETVSGQQKLIADVGDKTKQVSSNIVFGKISTRIPQDGRLFNRILILTNPTLDLGSLAEKECRRINAALDMAESEGLPVEWVPVSSGAKIDLNSGTENLDWTASTLKRIIEFTQNGGEINIIIYHLNVGAQSYWNAEATMLMHTRGLLIMTGEAAMLLTGKRALDFAGSVAAENNWEIGGVDRIMEPNGQAQFRTANIGDAYLILFQHYKFTQRQEQRENPELFLTKDPVHRDITLFPYDDPSVVDFKTIGDIFLPGKNAERKKPFRMGVLMEALIDGDGGFLERWKGMKDADTVIVWEAMLGGTGIGLIGIESHNIPRWGEVPFDGPENWNGGTLFPQSSKKLARSLNAYSGMMPVVILANLSGFDGSPESLRKLQLEYGAEIGRAVVNFQGPIFFVVTTRYHGGAYVVFSKRLNPNLRVLALEGSFASVIGGAPAAAIVFPGKLKKETLSDPKVMEARKRLSENREVTSASYERLFQKVLKEKQSAMARRFDEIHNIQRALDVGSIDEILSVKDLRPRLIELINIRNI